MSTSYTPVFVNSKQILIFVKSTTRKEEFFIHIFAIFKFSEKTNPNRLQRHSIITLR